MTARSHTLIAAAVTLPIALQSGSVGGTVAAVAAGIFGGLLPDIDHPSSTVSRGLPLVSLVWAPVHAGEFRHGRRLRFTKRITWHRCQVHSLLVGLVLSGPLWLWSWPLGACFLAGWLSHLVADVVNQSGLFYDHHRNGDQSAAATLAPWWPLPGKVRLPTWISVRQSSFFGSFWEEITQLVMGGLVVFEVVRFL